MSSAQRDLLPLDEAPAETEAAAPFALREQVAQRLAAHRARRTQQSNSSVTPIAQPNAGKSRSSRIAEAVAERYANSPSYRTFLAEQAEAAVREAKAAAEVAALSAQAIADAQYQLLAELDQWTLTPPTPAPVPPSPAPKLSTAETLIVEDLALGRLTDAPSSSPGLTVKLYEDVSRAPFQEAASSPSRPLIYETRGAYEAANEEEALALDEEIAFRQAPVFEESGPPIEIPANLIEFPRQLVAARKARPRLAEGPLREDADQAPHNVPAAQLRIFEVEAAQISTSPVVESVTPEWSSILLAAHPVSAPVETREAPFQPEHRPEAAPLNLRLMASVVDGCIISASFFVFVAAFALTVGKLSGNPASLVPMSLQTAAIGTAGTLAVLTLLYQLLFFTFGEATPGMRYARIGLCSLWDDNPTRSAMRRRIFATVLAACPLGIGFLWAWMDEDGLGWHDRISRMYQRSY
jgi:uncharacterized RDD family membrane protein YckC